MTQFRNSNVSRSSSVSDSGERQWLDDPSERYQIKSELARGGMGRVLLATDKNNSREVVIKTMLPAGQVDSTEIVTRFQREAVALGQLSHPNIVKIYHYGAVQTRNSVEPYFVMERIKGISLQKYVEKYRDQFQTTTDFVVLAQIVLDVARALQYCHERGLIHRDVKPDNILIEKKTNRAVLVDFGVVRMDSDQLRESLAQLDQQLTVEGDIVGSPGFMAPEQILGEKDNIQPWTDVWGIAATLYFCLSKHIVYDADGPVQLAKMAMTANPPRVASLKADLPAALAEICDQCLRRSVTRRLELGDVIQRLESYVADPTGQGTAARPMSGFQKAMIATIVAVVFTAIVMALVFSFKAEVKPLETFKFASIPMSSNVDTIEVQGSLSQVNADTKLAVNIGGKKKIYDFDSAGRIKIKLKLANRGRNELQFATVNPSTRQVSEWQTRVIDYDTTPPEFLKLDKAVTGYGKSATISGKLDGIGEIRAGESQWIKTESDGAFELNIDRGPETIVVVGKDGAGNETRGEVTVSWKPLIYVSKSFTTHPDATVVVDSLPVAIRNAEVGSKLVLFPGDFQAPSRISETILIESAEANNRARIIVGKDQEMHVSASNVQLKSLIIMARPVVLEGEPSTMLRLTGEGTLVEDCEFSCPGQDAIGSSSSRRNVSKDNVSVPITIRDCVIFSCHNGISLVGADVNVYNTVIRDCEYAGIKCAGIVTMELDGVSILRSKGFGIESYWDHKFVIQNSRFEFNAKNDLNFKAVPDVVVENCYFLKEGARAPAIQLHQTTMKVTNSLIDADTFNCVRLNLEGKLTVVDSTFIQRNNLPGIYQYITRGSRITMTGCYSNVDLTRLPWFKKSRGELRDFHRIVDKSLKKSN